MCHCGIDCCGKIQSFHVPLLRYRVFGIMARALWQIVRLSVIGWKGTAVFLPHNILFSWIQCGVRSTKPFQINSFGWLHVQRTILSHDIDSVQMTRDYQVMYTTSCLSRQYIIRWYIHQPSTTTALNATHETKEKNRYIRSFKTYEHEHSCAK